MRNWKQLDAEFGDRDFVVVLGLPWNAGPFATEYPEPSRVAGIPTLAPSA